MIFTLDHFCTYLLKNTPMRAEMVNVSLRARKIAFNPAGIISFQQTPFHLFLYQTNSLPVKRKSPQTFIFHVKHFINKSF
jgi:hypothetical protein